MQSSSGLLDLAAGIDEFLYFADFGGVLSRIRGVSMAN
jgi:hypothetical protein